MVDPPASLQESLEIFHPSRPAWYQKTYAILLDRLLKGYETQMADRKARLFNNINKEATMFLEIGVGTGPNIKHYANRKNVTLIGIDPNSHMEKYARTAASKAGLKDSQFQFFQGVAEALPVTSSSVDVVVCTLVLCSVKDIEATLREVKRVLQPGGIFVFVEHVGAPVTVGSSVRFWQNLLNPIQNLLADGCHLNRDTLSNIHAAGFSTVNAETIKVPGISIFSTQIVGSAHV